MSVQAFGCEILAQEEISLRDSGLSEELSNVREEGEVSVRICNLPGELSIHRADNACQRRRSSISNVSAHFDDLYAVLEEGRPSTTLIISDNASTHAIGWKEPICLPCLDDYNPMDDFMPDLLHEHGIRPRHVSIIFDNPSLDVLEEIALSSLQRQSKKAALPENEASSSQFDDSFVSVDNSSQLLSPVKYISPTSVLDAFHSTPILQSPSEKAVLPGNEASSPSKFDDSFESVDISRQLLSPVKESSPPSVVDAFPTSSIIQKMDSDYLF